MNGEDPTIPPHWEALSRALLPALKEVRLALQPGGGDGGLHPRGVDVGACTQAFQQAVARLVSQVNQTLGGLAAAPDPTREEIERGTRAFHAGVEALTDLLPWARAIMGSGPQREGGRLLEAVIQDFLRQLEGWLTELVQTLADPLAALRRQGVTGESAPTLRLAFQAAPAPELEALVAWLGARQAAAPGRMKVTATVRVEEKGPSFLEVIGFAALLRGLFR